MGSILRWLEEWHKDNAFEDGYVLNITIKALDNPGWMVEIDLNDTKYSGLSIDEIRIDNADDDWMTCRIENNRFCGFGDCLKLEKILEVFKGAIDTAKIRKKLSKLPDTFVSVKDSILKGNGYWYPLEREYAPEYETAVYDLGKLYKKDCEQIQLLEKVFKKAGIKKVRGFHPYSYEGQSTWLDIPDIATFLYEKDESGYTFDWINEEYYFDDSYEWIVYVSHENTITFCGDKLALIAEKVIPEKYRCGL